MVMAGGLAQDRWVVGRRRRGLQSDMGRRSRAGPSWLLDRSQRVDCAPVLDGYSLCRSKYELLIGANGDGWE